MKVVTNEPVRLARYSPDGRHVAMVSRSMKGLHGQGMIRVYEVGSWQQARFSIYEEEFPIECLAWSPDGTRLAYGGPAGVVKVWDRLKETTLITYLDHSPELTLPRCCDPQRRAVSALAWIDAERIVSAGQDECLRQWKASSGQTIHWVHHPHLAHHVVFSPPDAQFFAAFAPNTFWLEDEENTPERERVALYEVQTSHLVHVLAESEQMFCGAWSADAGLLALGSWDALRIWEMRLPDPPYLLSSLPVHLHAGLAEYDPSPHILAWSPDGKQLACATEWEHWRSRLDWHEMGNKRHLIEIWNRAEERWSREIPIGNVFCLAWSPDGTHLLVSEEDGFTILPSTDC